MISQKLPKSAMGMLGESGLAYFQTTPGRNLSHRVSPQDQVQLAKAVLGNPRRRFGPMR